MTEITFDAWQEMAKKLFPEGSDTVAFVCPSCGHVATVREYREAKAPDGAIGFSCIGRWTDADDRQTFQKQGGPCQYAGGGLIGLNPIRVTFPDGKVIDYFDFFVLDNALIEARKLLRSHSSMLLEKSKNFAPRHKELFSRIRELLVLLDKKYGPAE